MVKKMKKLEVNILSNEEISQGIYSMTIHSPEMAGQARPGQFVSLYTKDPSRLLPRPISICGYDTGKGTIRLVFRVAGAGTAEFARLTAGMTISVVGPLGNGYDINELNEIAGDAPLTVVGGGIGIPPMLGLCKAYKDAYPSAKINAVLGYRSNDTFLDEEFKAYADVFYSSDDGSIGTHGNVIDCIKENAVESGVLCACGPMPMLRGLVGYAKENSKKTFVSLEEKMACGIGACLACVTKTKEKDAHSQVNNARICKEGPVFDADVLDI